MIKVINRKRRLLAMTLAMLLVLNPLALPMMSVQASEATDGTSQVVTSIKESVSNSDGDGTDDMTQVSGNDIPQELSFEQDKVTIVYGTTPSYQQEATLKEECGVEYPNTEIVYSITEGAEIATIDADGTLHFQEGEVGTIVVIASKEGNERFQQGTANYTVTVEWEAASQDAYSLVDANGAELNLDQWYTGEVYIKAADGWKVNTSYDMNEESWEESLALSGDSKDVSCSFHLRNVEKGNGITAPLAVSGIKLDNSAPSGLKVSYSQEISMDEGIWGLIKTIYYNLTHQLVVTLEATDTLSGVASFTYYDVSGKSDLRGTVKANPVKGSDGKYTAEIVIEEDLVAQIGFSAKDNVGLENQTVDDKTVVMDTTAPSLQVEYEGWELATSVSGGDAIADYEAQTSTDVNLYYQKDANLYFRITEKNFFSSDVHITDNQTAVSADKVQWSRSKQDDVWIGQYTIPVQDSGEHVVALEYKDRSENQSESFTSEHLIMDDAAPNIQVRFETIPVRSSETPIYFGDGVSMQVSIYEENFTAKNVDMHLKVNGEMQDTVSGGDGAVGVLLQNGDNWTRVVDEDGQIHYDTVLTFAEDATYEVAFTCKDLANHSTTSTPVTFVVDQVAPEVEPMKAEDMYHLGAGTQVVDALGNLSSEINSDSGFVYPENTDFSFAIRETNFFAEDVQIVVTRDGVELVNGKDYEYNPLKDWSTEDNVHTLKLNLGLTENGIVDGDYQVTIQYCDRSGKAMEPFVSQVMSVDTTDPTITVTYDNNEAKYDQYYKAERTATIVVTDRNITGGQIVTSVSSCDAMGNAVAFDLSAKQSEWVKGAAPNTWETTITYDVDANYAFRVECKDVVEHSADATDAFVVDTQAPSNATFSFAYSNPIVEKILTAITFGFYNPDVTVRITAQDVTSAIDYFEWNYTKQEGAGDVNISAESHLITREQITYDAKKGTASAEFTLTASEAAQYRGNVAFSATDMAGNSSPFLTDSNHIIVVDNICPTRTVAYSPAKQVVSKDDMRTLENFSYVSENTNAILYYDAPMTMTFRIQEENFFAEDPVVKVNGTEVAVNNWTKVGNEWVGILTLSKDGSYVVTLEYMDNSQNQMQTYISEEIIIDVTNPVIEVTYSPDNMVQQIGDIKYYGEKQTATIVITESNFRAWDVNATVTAKNAAGEDVAVEDYASYLRNSANWVQDGDKHTATITFATDANYTFDIDYVDLVQRPANDVALATFTVDTVAPSNLTMSYSTSIVDMVLEGITFGFYNAPVTVTVTAEDDTSGVNRFEYSYIKASGVSDVNTEATSIVIAESEITYSNGRKTATATFQVPNSALDANHQFNGKVEFTANDCVNLNTKYADDKRIVVDNIAPNVQVEFSQSANVENDTYYFNGAMQATIHVTEANFYAEDVKVSVAKDGGNATEVSVAWTDSSVDNHVGTFTLNEDGEYVIYITYTDRSSNEAAAYQSSRLIIDTTKPVIRVQGVENYSANKEPVIGFVLTVEDVNMNGSTIHPSLMAEVKEADGSLRVVDMSSLGQVSTVVAGKNYIYTVSNLERDAIYSLECVAADMAGNETAELLVSGSAEESLATLQFSVNRDGSTYSLSEATRALNGSFSNEPVDVEIREINPNALNNIKLTLFKNDKTIELQEGSDYTIDFKGGDGSWYQYDYTIYRKNFEDDGIYRVAVYSEDGAGNVSQNTLDVKDVEISFGIDKTAPNLIITNLEDNETYPVENLTVIMQATDNMKLDSVKVQLDGEEHARWEQEEIEAKSAALEDFTFDIAGDKTKAHTVEVVLTDLAGNRTVREVGQFYVTTNMLVRVVNSKALPVAGAVATTGGVGAAAVVHGVKVGRFRRFKK